MAASCVYWHLCMEQRTKFTFWLYRNVEQVCRKTVQVKGLAPQGSSLEEGLLALDSCYLPQEREQYCQFCGMLQRMRKAALPSLKDEDSYQGWPEIRLHRFQVCSLGQMSWKMAFSLPMRCLRTDSITLSGCQPSMVNSEHVCSFFYLKVKKKIPSLREDLTISVGGRSQTSNQESDTQALRHLQVSNASFHLNELKERTGAI